MSLLLPPKTHPVRNMIDLEHLASLGDVKNQMKLPTLQQARLSALKILWSNEAINQVNILALNAKGELELVAFKASGEKETLWNFGKLND